MNLSRSGWRQRCKAILTVSTLAAGMATIPLLPARAESGDDAMTILKKMSDYVDAQQSIALLFESDIEVITPQLQKLQFSSSGQVLLDRPNKIHVTRHGGYADVDVYFDGKQVTIYGNNINAFASTEAPGTIDQLVDKLRSDGMDAPGADPLNNAYLALFARSLTATYPDFSPDQILTTDAMNRLREVGDHCVTVDMAFFFDLPHGDVVKSDWRSNATVLKFFNRSSVTGPIAGPMLVIASTDDESVPATTQDEAVARLCKGRAAIDYVRYAGFGLDHDGIERATTGLRLRWIHDRFSGLPAHSNCESLQAKH